MVENDDDKSTSFFVDCNNLGAQFVHAVANDVTVADILDPIYVPDIVNSFFLMNGILNHQGTSKPLLAVQVTELIDGIFIGCTLNHCVVDGSSFWHFFNTWSEISRGNNINPTSISPPISNVVILMVLSISHFIFLSITMKSLMRGPCLLP